MADIAIRVETYILRPLLSLSKGRVEGLSKLYTIGRAQQRDDTPSIALRTSLRDVSFEVKRGEVVG